MKTPTCALCLLLVLVHPARAAEARPMDPLAENLFPPELIMQHQSEIGLTDEQREAISSTMRQFQDRFARMHEQLQKEVEALGALLNKERVDEKAALAQFDKVQTREREIKRGHLEFVIGIKNKLTPEQQARLQEFKKQMAARGQPPASLPQKMEKIKAGVEDWQGSGRDPSGIGEIMQEFEPLMKAGKFKEAEAVLDRALKALGKGENEKSEDKSKKRNDATTP